MKLNIHNCQQAQATIDLLSSSSPAATPDKSALERHLSVCPACAREFSDRQQVKSLLKRAFKSTPAAPISLRLSIQNLIRGEA